MKDIIGNPIIKGSLVAFVKGGYTAVQYGRVTGIIENTDYNGDPFSEVEILQTNGNPITRGSKNIIVIFPTVEVMEDALYDSQT